jgi:predicted MFS family arabinose efflux permease
MTVSGFKKITSGRFDLKTIGIGLTGICAFLSLYATQPLLPHLEELFHASKVAVSLTVSAATLAVALSAPWMGLFADKKGRKKVIVPALCLMGVANLLTATATTLPALIAWRFLQGLLTPAVFAVAVAYVNEEWPKERVGFATSVYVTGTIIGGFSGRFLSGLTASIFGWRGVFLVLGALILLLTWGISTWLPLAKQFKKVSDYRVGLRNMADHLRNPDLLMIYAVGFVLLFSLVGTFTYITFYLAAPPFNLGPSALGSLFFVYLMGAVITPLVGSRVDRLDGKKTLALSLSTSALGVCLTLIPNLPCIIFGIALCSSGVFVCQVLTNQRVGAVAGKSRALAIGLYVAFYYAGGCVGSIAPGFLWDWDGWKACVALIAGLLILTAGFILVSWREKHLSGSHAGEGKGLGLPG